MNRVAIRWSDHDRRLGPFTYARDKNYRPLALVLGSGDDDDYPGCRLRLSGFGHTLIIALPPIVRPWRRKVFASTWDPATVMRLGRNWYWDAHARAFGFSYSEGFLQVFHGAQTHDSQTDRTWGCFLPWTQWRHVRHSLYGLDGSLFAHLPKNARWDSPERDEEDRLQAACPTAAFAFADFDGEALAVTTKIEEREWLFGTGWFKWLSLFRAPMVKRSLDLQFSGETGRRKGSWKGGTLGHSIVMLPGELHEAAFRRYCAEHGMTFVGDLPPEQSAAGHPVAVDGGKQAPQRSATERSTNNPAAPNRSGEP